MAFEWVSIIALAGWLVLALSAYRSYRISGRRTFAYVLAWVSIFIVVAMFFTAVGA